MKSNFLLLFITCLIHNIYPQFNGNQISGQLIVSRSKFDVEIYDTPKNSLKIDKLFGVNFIPASAYSSELINKLNLDSLINYIEKNTDTLIIFNDDGGNGIQILLNLNKVFFNDSLRFQNLNDSCLPILNNYSVKGLENYYKTYPVRIKFQKVFLTKMEALKAGIEIQDLKFRKNKICVFMIEKIYFEK